MAPNNGKLSTNGSKSNKSESTGTFTINPILLSCALLKLQANFRLTIHTFRVAKLTKTLPASFYRSSVATIK